MTRDKDRPRRPPAARAESRQAESRQAAREAAPSAPPANTPAPAAPARQRIAKAIARAGLCSRRDAEAWIVEGRVAVNGAVLTSPAVDVGPADAVVVDGAPLPIAEKTRLFLFHKPRGLVTSDRDPEGRETVADFLREHWPEGPRVVTIGRLDINTEGLLLLTNDGGLARVLELPKTGWVRRYRVRAKGETDQGVLDGLRDGVSLDGIDYAGIEATLDRSQGANCWLTMGLREGKNREIKRVLEHLGLEVNRLIRLSFGPFQLLDLAEGAVEEVRTRILRDQLGERIAAEAGVSFESPEMVAAPPVARGGDVTARTGATRGGNAPSARPSERRVGRSERPARPGRDERQWDRPEEPEPKRRERPAAGTRKHISVLRAESDAPLGPRRRVERSDTKDRRERTVTVERLVSTRPDKEPRVGPSAGRRGAARFTASAAEHASPSALAKRQRIAKSGGASDGPSGDRFGDRQAVTRRTGSRPPDGSRGKEGRAPTPTEPRGRPRRPEETDGGTSDRPFAKREAREVGATRDQRVRTRNGSSRSSASPNNASPDARKSNASPSAPSRNALSRNAPSRSDPNRTARSPSSANRDGAEVSRSRSGAPGKRREAAVDRRADSRTKEAPRAAARVGRDRDERTSGKPGRGASGSGRDKARAGPAGKDQRAKTAPSGPKSRPKGPPRGPGTPRRT